MLNMFYMLNDNHFSFNIHMIGFDLRLCFYFSGQNVKRGMQTKIQNRKTQKQDITTRKNKNNFVHTKVWLQSVHGPVSMVDHKS